MREWMKIQLRIPLNSSLTTRPLGEYSRAKTSLSLSCTSSLPHSGEQDVKRPRGQPAL